AAYYIPNDTGTNEQLPPLSISRLRDFLSEKLPDYMIPSYFVPLEEFPLTHSGKIDRKALPEPGENALLSKEYRAPTTKIEEKLSVIWQEVLGLPQIGVNDNFFEIGGHSVKAINIIAKIKKTFGVDLPLTKLFEKPLIKEQALYISSSATSLFIAVEAVEKRDYYPVSAAQKRLYALDRFTPDSVNYNMSGAKIIEGDLSKTHFEDAFRKLIKRHESLRTSFYVINGQPVQRIHDTIEFNVKSSEGANGYPPCTGHMDSRSDEPCVQPSSVHPTVATFLRPFEFSRAPLMRAELVKQEENKHIFLFDMHHIISDGVSIDIFIKEFSELYAGLELEPLKVQYKDYAAWQNRHLKSEELAGQKKYWQQKFADEIPVLGMPTDYPRPKIQSFEGATIAFGIHENLTAQLRSMAEKQGATLYMALLAVFNILLSKYCGQEDIIIGSPSAGRRHTDLENIIGMFVNTLSMRNFPASDRSLEDFLTEVKQNCLEAFENQDYQFDDLVEHLDLKRDLSRNPLFDVMFILQNLENEELEIKGLTFWPYELENKIAKFDITLQVTEEDNKLLVHLDYCLGLFKKETMERFAGHFVNILKDVITTPPLTIGQINILSKAEERQLLYEFNDTKAAYPINKTTHQLFKEQVERTPDLISIVGSGHPTSSIQSSSQPGIQHPASSIQSFSSFPSFPSTKSTPSTQSTHLTYSELDEKSSQLAHLLRKKGIKTNSIVGLMAGRSTDLVICILGILKAGGAYLPLNPQSPSGLNQHMLDDSNAIILLSIESESRRMSAWKGETILLEELTLSASYASTQLPLQSTDISQLAYIIYTSGSTGTPKGVPVTHANLCPLLHWGYDKLDIGPGDHSMQHLAYYFDWSVWEIFITLTTGADLYLITNEILLDPAALFEFICKNGITVFHSTPTKYGNLADLGLVPDNLKYLFLGAEKLTNDLLARSFASINDRCRVFNMYGPTEATIISAVLEMDRKNRDSYSPLTSVPIGRAVGNFQLFILDRDLNLCPILVAGELYIAGDGVAPGYLNNPDLTAEKFVIYNGYRDHEVIGGPNSPVLYRTGDLVRWLPDGNIEFLGRIDRQVKMRGFRIECGEVENHILAHERVKDVVVALKDDPGGDKNLIAYYVENEHSGKPPGAAEIRLFLNNRIPNYMVPAYFKKIPKIPMTPNGKIDLKQLESMTGELLSGKEFVPPKGETEQQIAAIWQNILGIDKIGTRDNYFEIGGNSLNVVSAKAKMDTELGMDIPVTLLFEHTTISTLADWVNGSRGSETASTETPDLSGE
ncbi:MAG: amino acid adenylation domain-containing protein, partial [bacterium]|nr:amino acid adenylation domain-containing protein [bacterium]